MDRIERMRALISNFSGQFVHIFCNLLFRRVSSRKGIKVYFTDDFNLRKALCQKALFCFSFIQFPLFFGTRCCNYIALIKNIICLIIFRRVYYYIKLTKKEFCTFLKLFQLQICFWLRYESV